MHVSTCRPCKESKEKNASEEAAGDQVSSSTAVLAAPEAVPAIEAPETVKVSAAPAAVESPAASLAAPEPMGESKSPAPADSMLHLAVKRNMLQHMYLALIALVDPEQ